MYVPKIMLLLPFSAASLLTAFTMLLSGRCAVALTNNATFPTILVFGDSLVDPGNNNFISTIAKVNFPPYGRDFPGGIPTGRFGNGKILSDFAAEFFGIKELLPAFLDPKLQLQDLLTGVSFASGGSGYDAFTAKIATALSMKEQLQLFKEYKYRIRASLGEQQTVSFISKALFIICTGSNDITYSYPLQSARYDIDSYTDLTVSSASYIIQELYELGARRVSVVGVPITGCLPSQRTLYGGLHRNCAEAENQVALLYNSKLSTLIGSLKRSLPGLKTVYLDSYYPLLSIIQNPEKYGFEEVSRGCCGTGYIEASILCNKLSDKISCRDASKFVYWDSAHASEKGYKILTPMIFSQHISELL